MCLLAFLIPIIIHSLWLQESASSISWLTTFGSARVLVSPSSSNCLEAIFLRTLRIIFPLLVFGRPGAQWILSGAAKAPIWNVQQNNLINHSFIYIHTKQRFEMLSEVPQDSQNYLPREPTTTTKKEIAIHLLSSFQ